jgi:hypothetical protein
MSTVIDAETKSRLDHVEDIKSPAEAEGLPDHLAPGSAYRNKVERRLKAKLDAKMFLLVIIYSESRHLSTREPAQRGEAHSVSVLNYIDRSNAAAAR